MNFLSPRSFSTLFFFLPWSALASCVVFTMAFPLAAQQSGVWILLGSALAFGLPHGACDLWAMQRAAQREDATQQNLGDKTSSTRTAVYRRKIPSSAKWMAAYIGAALTMLLLWRVHAPLALAVFLGLTVWHFGSADAWLHRILCLAPNASATNASATNASATDISANASVNATTYGANRNDTFSRWLLAWGRGIFVISAPLALQPRETHEILQRFAKLSGANHDIASWWQFALPTLFLGIVLQGAGHAASLRERTSSTRMSGRSDYRIARAPIWTRWDSALWLETLALLLLFALVPPLLAVACYFLAMHSWRHLLRLEMFGSCDAAKQRNAETSGDFDQTSLFDSMRFALRAVVQQHRHSWLLAMITLVGIVPILALWPSLLQGALQWNTAYLVLISAVTVPHVTVVSWLEAHHNL